METLEAIRTRRSIRQYTDRPVPQEAVQNLLQAAMQAPSARNYQPWHFIVINDRQMLDTIAREHPYADMLQQAPLAIVLCGDLTLEKESGYLAVNNAAATQNILLAAHDLGLGAVWIGVYPRESRIAMVSKILHLPEHILPIALVAVGYAAESKSAVNRFKPERVRYNRW
ncbi:MAG: nitroreductase family protein [Caldithrix sp.]|nr:nitroreductase family protein [Caldithrix sp.]